jgi:hypothetical protein
MLSSPCPDQIPDSLWQAYADTLFVYRDGEAIGVLRVGQKPDALTETLMQQAAVSSAVFITAYNAQHGSDLSPADNQARQQRLRDALQSQGLVWRAGTGIGRDTAYDPEASLLVLGVTERDAIQLGRDYGQNAVVWIESNEVVRLLVSR